MMMDAQTRADVQAQANLALKLAKELEVSDKWVENGTDPCQMFKMEVDSRLAAKGIAVAPIALKNMIAFLSPFENYPKYMENLKSNKKLWQQGNLRVIYQRFKGMGPVSDREFVCAGAREQVGGNKYYMVIKSCNYPFEGEQGAVRGEMYLGAFIMEALGQKSTRLTYISDLDLKGMIPGFIKNTISQGEGKMAHKMVECMIKQGLGK